jgi:hypothetical protein
VANGRIADRTSTTTYSGAHQHTGPHLHLPGPLSTGDERRVNTDPAGLQRTVLIKTDGSETTTLTARPLRTDTGDRGNDGARAEVTTIATPSGLTSTAPALNGIVGC